jgi:hypothetical protein
MPTGGGHLGRHSKDPATDRVIPEEHLDDQDSHVAQRDETGQDIRDGFHVGSISDAERLRSVPSGSKGKTVI